MLVVRLGVGDLAPVGAEDAEIVGRRDQRGTVFEDVGMSLDEGDAEVDRFSVGLSGVVAAAGPCRKIARNGSDVRASTCCKKPSSGFSRASRRSIAKALSRSLRAASRCSYRCSTTARLRYASANSV